MKRKILSLVLLSFLFGSTYAQTYCSISGNTTYEWINRVQLGSIDNTSGNNGGYADYTALSTSMGLGSSQTFTLTPGYGGGVYEENWAVYIDYNQDGDFYDAGEQVNIIGTTVNGTFTVPVTALTGNTRMRIVIGFDDTSPCNAVFYGEAEDYTVQITCAVPTGLAASNISNTAATVSWAAAGGATKYKLQYKTGTNTWTSVNNIAGTSYNITGLTANTNYKYRVQTVCGAGVTSAFSAIASFTTTHNYCGVGGGTDYGYINNVTLGSINNASGDNSGYADFTALSTSINTGSPQTISLTPDGGSHYYWEVYIDYNQDDDFYDAGEKAGQGDAYGPVNVPFTVPATALTGNTRMRIIMQYAIGYFNNPCGYFFGEAEDYTVNIATCNVPTGLAASSITADAATVSWAAAAGAKKYKLQYRTGTNPWTSVSNIVGTSYNITGLAVHTSYKYRLLSICGGGLSSAYSAAASFTTTNNYCALSGVTDYEWINRVRLGSINNTSGNNNGYGDYTALSTSIAAGSPQTIILTPGFTNNPDGEYWQVYIDYNQDGFFYDEGEEVGLGHGSGTKNIPFVVPATALNGNTRMRVVMNFDFYRNNPCATPGEFYGEAEDYIVEITGGAFNGVPLNVVAGNAVKANTLNSLVVAPNPLSTSSANLILQTVKEGVVSIRIAHLSGRILRSENISSVIAGRNTYALHNLNLLPGTYMIVAVQGNAIIARRRFIVAK